MFQDVSHFYFLQLVKQVVKQNPRVSSAASKQTAVAAYFSSKQLLLLILAPLVLQGLRGPAVLTSC